jgi:uncharacterized protein (DUF433 family)
MTSQISSPSEIPQRGVGRFCQNHVVSTTEIEADVYSRGIMNMSDAARYLSISQQTFHRWAKGYENGEPLLHLAAPSEALDATVTSQRGAAAGGEGVAAAVETQLWEPHVAHDGAAKYVAVKLKRSPTPRGRRFASVSFTTLTEAYVLEALRTAGVQVRKIRPALIELQQQFGTEFALTAPNLATDGIDVLWDFSKTFGGAGLIEARTGQTVMRAIVEDYLTYISREDDGRPARLQLPSCQPSKVIVDPHYGFGQPRFGASGARMIDVAAMLKAGETAEVVADEFGISAHDVGTAARILLGRAA